MLSFLKRKPNAAAAAELTKLAPRNRQQNIKVSEDCGIVFEALAKSEGMSKSDLFEDMVAERFERARRDGLRLDLKGGADHAVEDFDCG